MKLLFDQNLSHRLVGQLAAEFPGSAHVRDAALAAAPDMDVWAYAAANDFAIVSKDTDLPTAGPAVRPAAQGHLGPSRKQLDGRCGGIAQFTAVGHSGV